MNEDAADKGIVHAHRKLCDKRVDEVFFVDLPNSVEREEIIRCHLVRRGQVPDSIVNANQMASLVKASDQFTGAEIESAVVEAIITAFTAAKTSGKPLSLTYDMLHAAIRSTRPMAVREAAKVEAIRQQLADAMPVSSCRDKPRPIAARAPRGIAL